MEEEASVEELRTGTGRLRRTGAVRLILPEGATADISGFQPGAVR